MVLRLAWPDGMKLYQAGSRSLVSDRLRHILTYRIQMHGTTMNIQLSIIITYWYLLRTSWGFFSVKILCFCSKMFAGQSYILEVVLCFKMTVPVNFNMLLVQGHTIKNICDKIETLFETNIINYGQPLINGCHPELDTSQLLVGGYIFKYWMIVVCINWNFALFMFNVHYEDSIIGRYHIAPKHGHLEFSLKKAIGCI